MDLTSFCCALESHLGMLSFILSSLLSATTKTTQSLARSDPTGQVEFTSPKSNLFGRSTKTQPLVATPTSKSCSPQQVSLGLRGLHRNLIVTRLPLCGWLNSPSVGSFGWLARHEAL